MSDIQGILGIATKALRVQQRAINVTGNNIANVNTPGYTRQRLNISADNPVNTGMGLLGSGVRASEVERIYQRFLATQINGETQSLGQWEARRDMLERVEMVFDESGDYGLAQTMSEFWNAWQDLSNNPSGSVERTVLVAKSQMLASTIRKNYQDLQTIQYDIDARVASGVDKINQLSASIVDLNDKIVSLEAGGHTANDYRDQRDLVLKELSELIDINSFEDASGAVTVSVGSGQPLVEGTHRYSLSTQQNASGLKDVVWLDDDGNAVSITADIDGGKLAGWLTARDTDIPDYMTRLDTLAQNLISEVNTLHAAGYGLDGSTGNDFFSGTSANDIAVNSAIVNDTNLIAAADDYNAIPGGNGNAIAIASLREALTMDSGTATFDDYYGSLLSDVGHAVQQSQSYHDHQEQIVLHLENYRESISGVSIDEEMVNLVNYQKAYQAAARLVNTASEMMDTLLNMI